MIARCSFGLVLSVLAAASPARADRVLVLTGESRGDEDASVVHRIAAELRAIGLEPVIEEGTAALDDLFALARRRDAVAVINVLRDGTRARVWVADRTTGKISIRDVEASGDDRALALALRAVELLRASLLELHLETPPAAEIEASPAVRAVSVSAAAPPVAAVSIGVSAWWAIDGPGPLLGLAVAGRWRAVSWLALGLGLELPLAPPAVQAPEGSAELFAGRVALDVRATPIDPREAFQVSLGIGAAASWVLARARADAPYVARDADAFDGSVFARVAASFEWELLVVELAGVLDWAPAPVTIVIVERPEAQWGPLRMSIALSVGLRAG